MAKGVHENHAKGERHPKARLTAHDVELIRCLGEEGLSYAEIARKFEIPRNHARAICLYLKWAH